MSFGNHHVLVYHISLTARRHSMDAMSDHHMLLSGTSSIVVMINGKLMEICVGSLLSAPFNIFLPFRSNAFVLWAIKKCWDNKRQQKLGHKEQKMQFQLRLKLRMLSGNDSSVEAVTRILEGRWLRAKASAISTVFSVKRFARTTNIEIYNHPSRQLAKTINLRRRLDRCVDQIYVAGRVYWEPAFKLL